MGSRTYHSIRNTLFGAVDAVLSQLVPFVIRTIMIHTLGPEYLGLSNLFASVFTVLGLAELGIGSAMTYALYKPVAEDDRVTISALMALYRRIYGIIGTVIGTAGLALIPVLPSLVKSDLPAELNLYVVYLLSLSQTVFSYFFGAYKQALATAFQRNEINSIADILVRIVLYSVAITGLLTTRNYYLYASLFPIATVAKNLILSRAADRYYGEYLCGGRVSRKLLLDISRKVLALMGHKVGWVISSSIDNLSISAFLGLTVIAVYGNYHYVVKSLCALVGMLAGGISASIGNSIVLESPKKNYGDFVTFHFLYMAVVGVCCACLAALYQHFIRMFFGAEYLFGMDMVVLFTVYFFIRNIRVVPTTYKDAAGAWAEDALKPYVESFVNLTLNLVLVQILGVQGILIATIVSVLFVAFPWECAVLLKKVFHVSCLPFFARFAYYSLATAAACCIGCRVCQYLPPVGLGAFFVKGVVCALTAAAVLLIAYLPLPEFRSAARFLRKLVRKGRNR